MQHNGWKYFQKECKRYEINEDDSKIRILRLFLDRACSDWYLETFEVLTMEAGWSEWKKRFLDSFADRGWSTDMRAISYKYKKGSLIEYALWKEQLLLDMDKNLTSTILALLIIAGLPEEIRNNIKITVGT